MRFRRRERYPAVTGTSEQGPSEKCPDLQGGRVTQLLLYFMSVEKGPRAPGPTSLLREGGGLVLPKGHKKAGRQRIPENGSDCSCQGKRPLRRQRWQEEQAYRTGHILYSLPSSLTLVPSVWGTEERAS